MSRTLSQIYSEALLTRNNHLQITELDNGLTRSKLSLMNLLTYVMSALIYTYETVLDVFEYNIAQLILNRINGSAAWYALMATKFQYDTVTGQADPFGFNDKTMALEYDTIDESHRIIAKAAYRTNDVDNTLTLMVCKNNYFWTQDYDNLPFIANGDMFEVVRLRHEHEMYGFRFVDASLRAMDYDFEIDCMLWIDSLLADSPADTAAMQKQLFSRIAEDFPEIHNRKEMTKKIFESPYYNA